MEYFKIVPVVDEFGIHYEVHKYRDGYFGTKHLGTEGYIIHMARELRVEGSPKLFKTVEEATCFIRRHYGEQASIRKWRQL
jgi:hypothetical protein